MKPIDKWLFCMEQVYGLDLQDINTKIKKQPEVERWLKLVDTPLWRVMNENTNNIRTTNSSIKSS